MRMRDLLCGLAAFGSISAAFAQTAIGTAFTYQGQLKDDGSPAAGDYDLQFSLFNDTIQVGSTICIDNVTVVDGVFTVTLDFGGQFDGNKRFLEIGVRPAGALGDCATGGYTTLAPRQSITPAPYALKVAGIDGHSLDAADGSPVNALFVSNDGRVGVGTTSPGMSVQAGVLSYYGGPSIGVDNGTNWAYLHGAADHSLIWHSTGAMRFGTETARGVGYVERARLTNNGFFGLGTASPSERLDVRGNIAAQGSIRLDNATLPMITREADAFTSGAKQGFGRWGMFLDVGTLFLGVPGTDYAATSRLSFGGWQTDSTRQDWMTIVEGGNVGIGTISPAERLTVVGNASITTSLQVGTNLNVAQNANVTQSVNAASATIANSLEIGPDAPLDNPGNFSTAVEINGRSGAGVANPGSAAIVFTNSIYSTPLAWSMGVSNGGEFTFLYNGSAGFDIVNVPKLRITGGSDVAEPFNVNSDEATKRLSDEVKPGMVVSIDAKNPGELRVSNNKYDRTVAGIISGANGVNTGMVLTQKDSIADGQHPVALTGRVYCYVDADAAGPVKPGDMLTTSDTPGHAMKVRDYDAAQGAIIGKAMTSLDSGKGLVLVLVNLQ